VDVIKVEPDIATDACSIYSFDEIESFDDMKQEDSKVKAFPVKKRKCKPVSGKFCFRKNITFSAVSEVLQAAVPHRPKEPIRLV
jgi:hypothetical protein